MLCVKRICLYTIIISFLIFIVSCGTAKDDMATVKLDMGLKTTRGTPVGVSTVNIKVSGPEMTSFEKDFSPDADISFEVPSGKDRKFEVTATGKYGTFNGSATTDIDSGAKVTLTIAMAAEYMAESKLIIPDPYNDRLVQVDDMTGSGWTELTDVDLDIVVNFKPYDIEVDSQGRIYIALNRYDSPHIIRINDITDTSYVTIGYDSIWMQGLIGVALDESRNKIYGISESRLFWKDFDDTSSSTLTEITGLSTILSGDTISGIDVGSDGLVYISGVSNKAVYQVKVDSEGAVSLVGTYSASGPSGVQGSDYEVKDVMVKDSFIYLAICGTTEASEDDFIIRIPEVSDIGSLTSTDEQQFGTGTGPLDAQPTDVKKFMGPRRFIATSNRKFYVLDEYGDTSGGDNFDRVISFESFESETWEVLGTSGTGEKQFMLFINLSQV